MNNDESNLIKLQLISFTSDITALKPNDVFDKFLQVHTPQILKHSDKRLSFLWKHNNEEIKVMIYTITELNRDYNGINDVVCYFVFIHNIETDVNSVNDIITYIHNNCDRSRKVFIVCDKNEMNVQHAEQQLHDKLKPYGWNYQIKIVNVNEDKQLIAQFIMQTFDQCKLQLEKESENEMEMKDDGQSKSCTVI